ncbi:MAG TPA: DUF255 domain-containing protein [Phaeodactylibacter sp.]|nr:DUF255 domain-containing protein [Phaeodactylibacter sp.]
MKHRAFFILHLFSLALLLHACHTGKKGTQEEASTEDVNPYAFEFVESDLLSPVLEQAGREGKLVFIDMYATWCAPCRLMEEEVFTDEEVAAYFNENFINYRVDTEKGNGVNLAGIFEVRVLPTLLFLNEKGQVLVRKEGAAMQTEMLSLAKEAVARR